MSFEHGKNTVVKTERGLIRGFKYNDIYHFYGVKYAEAERFMPPREVESWEGIKEATSYGYICPGFNEDRIGNNLKNPHRFWPVSEDCLYLNIWTKNINNDVKKPVIVWFHGGGFFDGSSLEHLSYDGYNLCDRGDTVVITLNHRLNVLGYFDLSDYGEKYARSKNVGNLDLIAALQWVNKNIEYFGGDKDNVTIFGQSGGGAKVTSVMNMPASKGLFKAGMVMSGVVGESMSDYGKDTRPIVAKALELLGITRENIEDINKVPHKELCKAYREANKLLGNKGMPYIGPSKNEDYHGDPMHYGFLEQAKAAPLIVGSNFSEFYSLPAKYNRNEMSDEEMIQAVENEFGKEKADKIIPLFTKAFPNNKIIDVLAYDCSIVRKPTLDFVKRRGAECEAPTYNYLFTAIYGINDGSTPLHSSDIVFAFGNTHMVPSTYMDGYEKEIEYQMSGRLLALAKTGKPQLEDCDEWHEATADSVPTLIFDRKCEEKVDFDKELLDEMTQIRSAEMII